MNYSLLNQKGDTMITRIFKLQRMIIRGASRMVQTLVSGDIDIAHVAANPAVEANLSGADVVVLATALNRPVGFYMMGQPGVKKVEGLRGGRVGSTQFGSATDLLSRMALRH